MKTKQSQETVFYSPSITALLFLHIILRISHHHSVYVAMINNNNKMHTPYTHAYAQLYSIHTDVSAETR